MKANTLVREANFLAEEMNKLTDYHVTLQIPAANLSANRKVGMDGSGGWESMTLQTRIQRSSLGDPKGNLPVGKCPMGKHAV